MTLAASETLPAGVSAPTGRLRLPKQPIRMDDAVIVIRNADLVKLFESSDRRR